MRREDWWPTPIFTDIYDFDPRPAVEYCLNLRKNNYTNRKRSNRGGWQSTDLVKSEHPELHYIFKYIMQGMRDLCANVHPEFRCELGNVWVNINEHGNENVKHVHPYCIFAGTIYLQTDENSGDIVFSNPFIPLEHYGVDLPHDCNLFYEIVTYKPCNGMIIFFPAWMPHHVKPSQSDSSRISMSFNICQLKD